MNAEQSRDKEILLPTFTLPRNLTPDKAVNIFNTLYKPKNFKLERFKYNPDSGLFAAIGTEKVDEWEKR